MAGFLGGGGAAGSDTAAANEGAETYETGIGAYGLTAVIELVSILEYYGVLPSPIHLLISAFSGRPREEATAQSIFWLTNQRNPAARLWGVALSRLLTDSDIVISSSDPGDQQLLGQARASFVKSLVAQGATAANAQTIADIAMSTAAQNGSAVSDFLKQPGPTNFGILGDADWLRTYAKGLQLYGIQIVKSGQQPKNTPEKYLYQHAPLNSLLGAWYGPPGPLSYQPTAPTDPTVNPCKPGYVYNYLTNTCLIAYQQTGPFGVGCNTGYSLDPSGLICQLDPQPQPPPAQTGGGGGGNGGSTGGGGGNGGGTIPMPPGPTQGGDELNDCCNLSATYLYYVATAIQNLATQFGATSTNPNAPAISACCAQLTAQIQAIAAAITGLPAALGLGVGSGPAPVDLSLIVAALATLDADLKQGNANAFAGAAEISSAIANVGSAIASAPPTDTTPLVNALTKLTAMFDIQQSTIDDLAAKGYIAPGDVQFYQGLPGVDGFFHKAYTEFHDLVRGMVMGGAGIDPDTGDTGLATNTQFLTWLTKLIGTTLKAEDDIVSPVLDPLIAAITKQLTPAGGTTYGNVGVDPDVPVKTSFGVAITATFLSALLSYFGIDLGEPVTRIAELIGAAIGIEELKDVTLGPLIREGIAKQATHNAKSIFRQDAPGYEGLAHLAARGHITVTRAAALAPLSGIPAEFVTPLQNAAYSNIGERTLIRLIETNLFSTADLTAVLTEHGMNARDQARTQLAAPFLATVSQRNALQAAVEKQFVEGLIDAPTLTSELESLQQNSDYINLITTRCQIDQQIAIAKELANSYTILALTGTVDLNLYATQLEGLGYQPIAVNAMVAVVESKLTATNLRQAAAAERALERATVNIERRAALKNYSNGVIDSAGLAIALIATGLTSIQAAAWVDLAVLRKDGSPRLTYGLLKSPPDAQLLRARVTSLTDQRKKQLISDLLYIQALQALGIPQNWINALRAAADAESTPASANEFVPVTTG